LARAPATWPQAAGRLARRIRRRERIGAAVGPLGRALLLGGAAGVALKLGGAAAFWPPLVLGASLALGLLGAIHALGRVPRVAPADAAWALDRVAGAKERGLVAATVPGPVGAEAAWAAGRLDPPQVGLLPPRGLATALGGVLAVVLALLVPTARTESLPLAGTGGAVVEAAGGGGGDLRADPGQADAARAEATAAVREALGLGPQAATDSERVAERLADERLRDAARDAAPEGSEVAALLARGASPDLVAEALGAGGQAEARARAARRRAAALLAGQAVLPVPAHRRALLERYSRRRNARVPTGEGGR
jgi:hypothetical protein